MNKRQAKKQFKKRYGVTPNQMTIQLTSGLNELTTTVIPRCVKALAAVLDDIAAFLRSDIFRELARRNVAGSGKAAAGIWRQDHCPEAAPLKNKEGADNDNRQMRQMRQKRQMRENRSR